MDYNDNIQFEIPDTEFEIKTTRGSGKGGQNRNKVETAVIVKHIPTGITVRCENERSQFSNKQLAIKIIKNKLKLNELNTINNKLSIDKRNQVKSGNRSEKIKTYNVKLNKITDHITNKNYILSDWKKGKIF